MYLKITYSLIFERFSGSDISVLIRDASYEPLRIAQIADKFKKIQGTDG